MRRCTPRKSGAQRASSGSAHPLAQWLPQARLRREQAARGRIISIKVVLLEGHAASRTRGRPADWREGPEQVSKELLIVGAHLVRFPDNK